MPGWYEKKYAATLPGCKLFRFDRTESSNIDLRKLRRVLGSTFTTTRTRISSRNFQLEYEAPRELTVEELQPIWILPMYWDTVDEQWKRGTGRDNFWDTT
ncbi:uncharacterized protein PV07_12147 [Cladophialophora immunda]|uniref:Uncharacterized protein n=1 Tax=Cladophialophora immunda TaxID=569365 RepID=A0A0D1Z3J1_9EURO|nr:uncharacterized protein PV07_12147 [Cladophialophora immunda]KIW22241.1 hypothetical protein PV07_12147 [Cladophialophora immunda]OQU99808.1 hypothetical protein CLAIMM_05388 [Cladophialophora immunda]